MVLKTVVQRVALLTLVNLLVCCFVFPSLGTRASTLERNLPEELLDQSDQAERAVPSLDIARAVPYPADFPDLAPSLGFLDGRFVSGEDQALRSLNGNADDTTLRGAKRQLLRAGWLRRYENRLAAPLAGDPDRFGVQVSSFVVEYASPQEAATAFAALAQQQDSAPSASVGDESLVLEFEGTTPDTNSAYRAVKLFFRVGPLVCSMTFADLTGAAPPIDAIAAAGLLVAERARIVVDQGTVPLGSMLLQFTERGDSRNDVYATRAGVQTSLLSELTLNTFAVPPAAGDAFVSHLASVVASPLTVLNPGSDAQSVIEIEGEAASTPLPVRITNAALTPEITLFTALFSFNADSEAAEWLNAASSEVVQSHEGGLAQIESPSLGVESVAFRVKADAQSLDLSGGYVLLARLGPIGVIQELHSSTGVSFEGAANVMRQQLACIAQGGCAGVAEVPRSIFGGRDVPLSVSLAPVAPRQSAETDTPVPVVESPPQPESVDIAEAVPEATAEETAPIDIVSEVPEVLTEPEITSAPASEELPEPVLPEGLPAEPTPSASSESALEPSPTSPPDADDQQTPAEAQETPVPVAEEAPAPTSAETPVATTESTTEADSTTAPTVSTDLPAPEATAAPIPADAPIGATAPPPADEVVQTPSESEDTATATTPEFTEPVPAATEPEPGNDNGNRDSRRDRDRKKDREGRDVKG